MNAMNAKLLAVAMGVSLGTLAAVAQVHAASCYELMQTVSLVEKVDKGGEPWTWRVPTEDSKVGKLRFYSCSLSEDDPAFNFLFSGYKIPADEDFALIYYVDPAPEWPAEVYVLGVGEARGCVRCDRTPNLVIAGSCEVMDNEVTDNGRVFKTIPVEGDVNYPNGGKIWLIPSKYLESEVAPCTWNTMVGWPDDVSEILFETSLITYGFDTE